MRVESHRLVRDDGSAVAFRESPNQSGAIEPCYLVMHYTAGADAPSAIDWLCRPEAKASAHLVIGRDGSLTQLVPFNRKAWHAGESRWFDRAGLNGCSIGIELDNHGICDGGLGRWRFAGRPVDDEEVSELPHPFDGRTRGWHSYTPAQLEVAREVAAALAAHYRLIDVVGHEDIAPGRKWDPGPAFPMARFRAQVLGRDRDGPALLEVVSPVNLRDGPGTGQAVLAGSPLPAGTRLEALRREGSWVLVDRTEDGPDADGEGWVHWHYVTPLRQ